MSRRPMLHPVGPELSTVVTARRRFVLVLSLVTLGWAALGAAVSFTVLPLGQALIPLLASPLLVVIYRRRNSDAALAPGLAALAIVAASTLFSDPESSVRVSSATTVFALSYAGVVTVPKRWQAVWISACAGLWYAIMHTQPYLVDVRGLTLNLRWSTFIQLAVSSACLANVWNTELQRLKFRDAEEAAADADTMEAIALRERMRVWRDSVVRIHETVLNDIRSIVDVDVTQAQLRQMPRRSGMAAAPPSQTPRTIIAIVASIIETEHLQGHVVLGGNTDVPLTAQQSVALRGMLLEIIRNLFRHSGTRRIAVRSTVLKNNLHIIVQYDGESRSTTDVEAGIGLAIVLRETLDSLHAKLDQWSDAVRLQVPLDDASDPQPVAPHNDSARMILGGLAAGNAVGGALAYVALLLSGNATGSVIATLAIWTSVVAAWAASRREPIPTSLVLSGTVAATLVPVLTTFLVSDCGAADLPVMVSALSSIGVAAVVAGAPTPNWWWVAIISVALTVPIGGIAATPCGAHLEPTLITAFISPVMLSAIYYSVQQFIRRQHASTEKRHALVRETAAAEAARDLAAHLHDAVVDAEALVADVVEQGALTPEAAHRLRCLDADIRATIQVDPALSGAFSVTARDATLHAVRAGLPVRVLALRDSGDRRPLPAQVCTVVTDLLLASADGEATVQTIVSGDVDTLVVTTSQAAAQRAGLAHGWEMRFEDGDASIDYVDEDDPAVLIVQRQARDVVSRELDS